MSEQTSQSPGLFSDVFGAVISDPLLLRRFEQTSVTRIRYHRAQRKLDVMLALHGPIDGASLEAAEACLATAFSAHAEILPRVSRPMPPEQMVREYASMILGLVKRRQRHMAELLEGASLSAGSRGTLRLELPTACAAALSAAGTCRCLEQVVSQCFGRDLHAHLVEPDLHPEHEVMYLARKQELEAKLVTEALAAPPVPRERKTPQAQDGGWNRQPNPSPQGWGSGANPPAGNAQGGFGKGSSGFGGNQPGGFGRRESRKTEEGAIYGRKVTGAPLSMVDVTSDSGEVVVAGRVLKCELRELKSGRKLFTFDLTDGTSSVTCKCFPDEARVEALTAAVKPGAGVKLRGEAQYDKFSDEMCLMMRDASPHQLNEVKRRDNAPVKRVELHLHTQMSSLDAISGTKAMIRRAAAWGHKAVAITDHGVVQAFPDAQDVAGTLAKKDNTPIKILYGLEGYLVPDEPGSVNEGKDRKDIESYHVIVLVRDQTGLKNLYRMVSESHLDHFYKKPRIPRSLLDRYREGLVLGSACEAGEVFRAVLDGADGESLRRIAGYYDYLEIQPVGNNQFLLSEGIHARTVEDLRDFNRRIVHLGEEMGKPVVATCDVHFLDPEDAVFRKILQAGQGYKDAEHQPPLYFRTTDEMLEEFAYLGREKAYEVVVTNTNLVADWLEEVKPIPSGTFPPHMDGAEEDIRRMSEEKIASLYGDPLPELVRARVDRELNSIIKNGFSVMYMIAQKLVKKSNDDGYLVGSRGSVGSSLVAYLIGITEVNSLPAHYRCDKCLFSEFHEKDKAIGCGFDLPDKSCPHCGTPLIKDGYDIPFETFLGFDGDKEPDIDLNFSGEYQPRAHKYTEELFGEGYVFRAGTIATIADKTAFGFVNRYFEERGLVATKAERERLASGCTGIKRTTGQHPGGVMVCPKNMDIFDFTPIQRPADAVDSDIITTHFDYHSISGRILKLDILGHDDPTVIRMLEDLTGLNAQEIPIGEKRTMEIFRSTEPLGVRPEQINSEVGTFGVPEFGTKFVRQMLVDTMPTTFAELIRISGLSHGTDVWLNNAQELVRAGVTGLADVISTRDDIMIYLIKNDLPPLTAFKIMESVRKGKGLSQEQEALMREKGVPDWYIDSCKKIKYMFPKAHAAAYVMMAFRIAWFKVYHPMAFYTAYYSVRADGFDANVVARGPEAIRRAMREIELKGKGATQKEQDLYTILEVCQEMYARGIRVLPVDLYRSDATRFQMTEEGILPPFTALQGLGASAARNIAAARDGEPFLSQEDLKIRAGVSKAVIEILEGHGVLAGLDASSQLCFF